MKIYDEALVKIAKAKLRKQKRSEKSKVLFPKGESDFDACERLWREIIFLRAGYRSELSGKPGHQFMKGGTVLHPHHILRKPNYCLRFSLDNGICLTEWEHSRGIHGKHEEKYRRLIIEKRGADIYDRLYLMKQNTTDLYLTRLHLEQEFAKLKDNDNV